MVKDLTLPKYSNRLALFAAIVLVAIASFALFAPHFSSYTYYEIDLLNKNQMPSFTHWFGTDDLGRDIFIRMWYGARISLFVGIVAAAIDLVIGVIWGAIAALSGGKIDEAMMRFIDVVSAIPSMLITISLMVLMGQGLHTIIIALSLLGWMTMARIVRSQLLQLKSLEYVLAAKSLGASFSRILFKHLIPNALGPILVTLTLTIPTAIYTESFLSYLGLGVQAPISSLGTMANEGLQALEYYPWRLLLPAGLISLITLSFNLLGDHLSQVYDVKQ